MKEDSTVGRSPINPFNYKGDVMVQVWMDSRLLVTLLEWLIRSKAEPRFLSEVVRMPLESMVKVLVDSGEAEMIDDTMEARAILERTFKIRLNKRDRGMKNVMHNVVLSDRRKDLAEEVRRRHEERETGFRTWLRTDANQPMTQAERIRVLSAAAEKKYHELFDDEDRKKDTTSNESRPIVKEQMTDEEFDDKMNDIAKHDADENAKMDEFLASLGKGDGSKIKQSNGDE